METSSGPISRESLGKMKGSSVKNWRSKKSSLRKKLKMSKLPGGLLEWNKIKRAKSDARKLKESWIYQKINTETKRFEAEREELRIKRCNISKEKEKQKLAEDKYFQELLQQCTEVNQGDIQDSFDPDDRDLGLRGWPIHQDSDDEI